jgi:hypothetical protein
VTVPAVLALLAFPPGAATTIPPPRDPMQLTGAKLQPGARIAVRVTTMSQIGRFFQYRIRAAKPPRITALCIPLGGDVPKPC